MDNPTRKRFDRSIEFEGTRNFRDMGGVPVGSGVTRFGVAFRSDRLSNLTAADGVALGRLRIATIIDMRSAEERGHSPNRLPPDLEARQLARAFLPRHTLSMFDAINAGADAGAAHALMLRQYESLALDHMDDYRVILDDLLAPGALPAVFHCTSGKDRTGMIAAILLLTLGASEDAVTADFVMTQGRIEKVDYFDDDADRAAVDAVMAAKPDYMAAALAAMRAHYGSVENYLVDGVGVSPEKRRRLSELLVES